MSRKFYLVTCSRGHVGIGNSSEICFAIAAKNILDACRSAKRMPSVKHTRGVLNAREISLEEYTRYRQNSAYNRANAMYPVP